MNIEKYEFSERQTLKKDVITYYFESVGTKGTIQKGVFFQPKSNGFEYNMALGDIDPITNNPDFETYSNNGDLKKVFATVFGIGMDFFKQYPNSVIHFLGNEKRKTKIYHWIISKHLEELSQYFRIFGVLLFEDEMEIFNPESEYYSFMITPKKEFSTKKL